MSGPTLWLVSPVYLDVESYLQVRERALATIGKLPGAAFAQVQLVAIDDTGGLDPAIDRLRALPDQTVVVPPFNLGHQRAIVFGLRSLASRIAPEDFVVTMDSDGEDLPEDLPRLLQPLFAEPEKLRKVALAWRTSRTASASFKVLYFFFKVLFRTLTGLVVRSGNFAAYRGRVVRQVLFHPHFDLCYSSSLVSLDLTVEYVPLARGRRFAGESRMSYTRLLTHGVSMLLPFTDRIAIRALVAVALVLGATGAAGAAATLWSTFGAVGPPPWFWRTALVLNLLSFVAFGNLILLFAAFVQARGSLLRNIEDEHGELSRGPSQRPA